MRCVWDSKRLSKQFPRNLPRCLLIKKRDTFLRCVWDSSTKVSPQHYPDYKTRHLSALRLGFQEAFQAISKKSTTALPWLNNATPFCVAFGIQRGFPSNFQEIYQGVFWLNNATPFCVAFGIQRGFPSNFQEIYHSVALVK